MKHISYEILAVGITDTRDAEIGRDIYYKCDICGAVISSMPKDNVGCTCGNIAIDKDLHRLFVEDYSRFITLRKK